MEKTIILFDVDGTLTESRKIVKKNMIDTLIKLKKIENLDIAIVGGSNLEKQNEQLGEHNLKLFDYVFSENGLVAFKNNELFHSQSIINVIGEKSYKILVNICMEAIIKCDSPKKRGTFIELRTGMVNISPIGRSCSQEERNEFYQLDLIHKYREEMIKYISNKWKIYQYESEDEIIDLSFSIGGQISIDIFPEGWDKTYCLKFIKEKYEKYIFFGDKTMKGGNDYEIFNHSLTIGYTVQNPEDTIQKLNYLFNLT